MDDHFTLPVDHHEDDLSDGQRNGAGSRVDKQPLLLRNRPRSASTQACENVSGQPNSNVTWKILICGFFWYIFSFTTLFLNKYILASLDGDPTVLSTFQMSMCAIVGYFHLKVPLGLENVSSFNGSKRHSYEHHNRSQVRLIHFKKSLLFVGCFRCCTIMLGLVALWYVPVSFAETVKSSAPVFTVLLARLLLGERTNLLINLSLVPVMMGLALCSAYELSLTLPGLLASLAGVLSECIQNVYSKKLLSNERYEPHVLQFYTSVAAFVLQLPSFLLLVNFSSLFDSISQENNLLMAYILGGISFHCQSLSEYILLGYISPVTHSVANTSKRALLIWLSVLTFGNRVTSLSWLGSALVIVGVLMYNKAKNQTINEIVSKENRHDV